MDQSSGGAAAKVVVTRVINPCALIEVESAAILTDPYFTGRWFVPMNEPIGMSPDRLPKLTAIIGGHGAFDHWQVSSLRGHTALHATPVFVANETMRRSARRAGFVDVEVLRWGEVRHVSDELTITSVAGGRTLGRTTNCYVIDTPNTSVFVGTEAKGLGPVERFAEHRRVDVAVLPIDGLEVFGRRLVMDAATALSATRRLGARTLVPIHYSQRRIPGLLECPSGIEELLALAADDPQVKVCHAPAGRRIEIRD